MGSMSEQVGTVKASLIQDEDACTPSYGTSEIGPVNLSVEGPESLPAVAGVAGEKAFFVWQAQDQVVGYDGEVPINDQGWGIFARVVHRNGTSFTPSSGLDYWINAHENDPTAQHDQTVPDVSAYTNATSSRVGVVWVSRNEYGSSTADDIRASVWTWSNTTLSLTHNATYDPTTTHTNDQLDPAIAYVWGGQSHIVVWSSEGDVYLSKCGNTGSCSPKEQKVNTSGFQNCEKPRVDAFREGDHEGYFVVVLSCVDTLPDPDTQQRVYYRRYDASATALDTSLVLVNTNENHDDAVQPDVACLNNDDFVVVYQYDHMVEGYTDPFPRIRHHHVQFDGTDVAADAYVSSTSDVSWWPRVAAYRDGTRYGVVWFQFVGLGDTDVVFRRYEQATGYAIDGGPVVSGGTTDGLQGLPAVDTLKCSGGWAMGWISDHADGTGSNEDFEVYGIFRND